MNEDILYFECFSGISGDMTVSALLDIGADKDVLIKSLESLGVDGYKINISKRQKCGINGVAFDVILDSEQHEHEVHHHHHDHSHEHEHHHHYDRSHEHEHHHHDHSHEYEHYHHNHEHHHHHEHRNINDVFEIIERGNITENAKNIAKDIFMKVAEAESKAHNKPLNEVHFHEVGAIDSIVDIVATAVCIDNLGIKRFVFSKICEGTGYVKCQHGILPVPVPAVMNIFSNSDLIMKITDNNGEMITPTGAAIAASLSNEKSLPESFKIIKTGIGTGKKDFKNANILRVMILREQKTTEDNMVMIETNIDDSTPEALSYTMDKLFENGANDVFFTNIYMKKNRPAVMLSVLCKENVVSVMSDIIFENLTTIGIKKYIVNRDVMEREIKEFQSSLGKCRIKICKRNGNVYKYPEFEDIKKICNEKGIGFDECMNIVKYECKKAVF